MAKKEKKVKKFIYKGLGFPIVLKNVIFRHIGSEWLPKIDVENLAK